MPDQDLDLQRIEPAVIDLERLAPREEEAFSLVVGDTAEDKVVLPCPDAWSERRRSVPNLLLELTERRSLV